MSVCDAFLNVCDFLGVHAACVLDFSHQPELCALAREKKSEKADFS